MDKNPGLLGSREDGNPENCWFLVCLDLLRTYERLDIKSVDSDPYSYRTEIYNIRVMKSKNIFLTGTS